MKIGKVAEGKENNPYKVAIIIDDIGYSREKALNFMAISNKITLSILPFSLYGQEIAEKAVLLDIEII